MDFLGRMEEEFAARRASGALSRAFQRWQMNHQSLRAFGDVEALIAACREPTGAARGTADVALSALCSEAASGDECAGILLQWLLLPGLLLARARIAQLGVLSPEDLTAEMMAGLWAEATRLPAPTRRVARHLVNSARWRALAAVREAIDWTGRIAPLPEVADRSAEGEYKTAAHDGDSITRAVRKGVLSPEQAGLVLADRRAIREISDALGISVSTARKRRYRARSRFRAWVERDLTGS